MICKNVPVWEDKPEILMQAYILGNSLEFDQGRKRPVALVIPGGGYMMTSDREAEHVALAFTAKGYHAFVLRYSIKEKACLPQPILDAFKAISVIRAHAEEWYVDTDKIVACGFSAGGHLASCLATMWNKPEFSETLGCSADRIKPNAVILSYACVALPNPAEPYNTGMPASALEAFRAQAGSEALGDAVFVQDGTIFIDIGQRMHSYLAGKKDWTDGDLKPYSTDLLFSGDTVPSFVWATRTDELVPVSGSMRYVQAMLDHGRSVEFHLFAEGPHGLSLATDLTAGSPNMISQEVAAWFDMAIAWLAKTLG